MFRQGFNDVVQMELECRDYSLMLHQFIQLAVCTDNLLRTPKPRSTSVAISHAQISVMEFESMEVAQANQSTREKKHHKRMGLCLTGE